MSKKKTASCTCCGKTYEKSAGFYQSLSPIYESNDNRMHICKNCVCNIFDKFVDLFVRRFVKLIGSTFEWSYGPRHSIWSILH